MIKNREVKEKCPEGDEAPGHSMEATTSDQWGPL